MLFRITIPQLATVIEFYVVIMVITMLSWVFNYVYVMTSGGPGNATMVAEFYIYLEGFRYNLQGVAAAASMVLLAITALLITLRGRHHAEDRAGMKPIGTTGPAHSQERLEAGPSRALLLPVPLPPVLAHRHRLQGRRPST